MGAGGAVVELGVARGRADSCESQGPIHIVRLQRFQQREALNRLLRVRGELYAMDSICYHAGGPLTAGDIEDIVVDGAKIPCVRA